MPDHSTSAIAGHRPRLLAICTTIDSMETIFPGVGSIQLQPNQAEDLTVQLHEQLLDEVAQCLMVMGDEDGDVRRSLQLLQQRLSLPSDDDLPLWFDGIRQAGIGLRAAAAKIPASPLLEALAVPEQGSFPIPAWAEWFNAQNTQAEQRPKHPTAKYCLAVRGKIRWKGECKAAPRHRDMLERLLRSNHLSITGVKVRQRGTKRYAIAEGSCRNDLTAMNNVLEEIRFPWTVEYDFKEDRASLVPPKKKRIHRKV
jgi:hypothetical protein